MKKRKKTEPAAPSSKRRPTPTSRCRSSTRPEDTAVTAAPVELLQEVGVRPGRLGRPDARGRAPPRWRRWRRRRPRRAANSTRRPSCRRRPRRSHSRACSRACCSRAIGRCRSSDLKRLVGRARRRQGRRGAGGAARPPRPGGQRHPGGRGRRRVAPADQSRQRGVGVAPGRGQAAAADARDAGDAVHRRVPPADHAPGDRRRARRRLRPGAEDAARSRAGADDRQEGGGRAADPLRHHAGVPAHLHPEAISPSCRRCASSTSWARPRWRRSTPRRPLRGGRGAPRPRPKAGGRRRRRARAGSGRGRRAADRARTRGARRQAAGATEAPTAPPARRRPKKRQAPPSTE